ncbi:MAG TPA: MBL fold metallo-hydrolase [Bryobacterales bacterium]|jgi:hydroxyacylglutathione hydrolase|nr:MBL fold metallo-hydrolase [Bryobacterales bacterium]
MIHTILPVGILQCNCSIFGDETTREALVVDPGDELPEILKIVGQHGLHVTAIAITHAHIDHIGGAAALRRLTGAAVYMNERDLPIAKQLAMQAAWLRVPVPEQPQIDVTVKEGDLIRLAGCTFQVLDTPGHTPGSISLLAAQENKLLAGDTLFRDSIGRTDLPGGDSRHILASIKNKILTLDDSLIVVPGHGELTTVGREREHNYFLKGL